MGSPGSLVIMNRARTWRLKQFALPMKPRKYFFLRSIIVPVHIGVCLLLGLSGLSLQTVQGQTVQGQAVQGQRAPQPAPTPTPNPSATPASAKRPSEFQKALDEFRVQMGQFSVTGDAAGKDARRLKAVGKQNRYTGRLYENLRNDLFDAVPHEVRQRGGNKSLLRRNQYGFSVSGPVHLPWLYDGRGRTFFTTSFEGTRERIAQSALFTLPTERQRSGDFSDLVDTAGNPVQIFDPATTRPNPNYNPAKPVSRDNLQYLRDPFPGNIIPANRLDPVARALLALYPKPNTSVGPFLQNNYWINSPFENRANGVIAKVDHRLTEKQQFSANFNLSRGARKSPQYFPGPANSGNPSYNFENGSLSVQDTYTVSPRIVWTLRVASSYSVTESLTTDETQNYPQQLGLSGVFSGYFPRFTFSSNYLSLGPATAVFSDRSAVYNVTSGVTVTHNSHTLRFTFLGQHRQVNSYSPSYPAGWFYFSAGLTSLPGINNTGNSFAQLLLGQVTRAEEGLVLHPSYYRNNFVDVNVSDEWRVRPGLTASFSLSAEISTPRVEKYDRQATVSLSRLNPANGKPGALIFAGQDGAGRALQPVTTRLEPTLGMAFNPWNNRNTIVRANYSLNYSELPLAGRHFGTNGFNATPVFISPNEQLQAAFQLRNGLPNNFRQPPFLDATAANGIDADYFEPSGLLPINQQWTLSLQRELPRSLSLDARYTGWTGAHQFVDGFVRLNAVPLENLVYRDQLYDDAFRNSLRPYPQYRNLDLGGVYPGGDLEGHALSLTLDQRMKGGLFGRVSYRLAKLMDNYSSGAAQDPYNLAEEWSISDDDITHSVQVSYTYEFPFGKGKRFFNDGTVTGNVLGGWSLSGLTTWRGGLPLTLRPLFNRTGGLVTHLRVNEVPGVNPHVEDPSAQQWFNSDAFAQPDDFSLGNVSRTHPSLRAPGAQFHHLSLTKRVELSADASLELVSEAFNFPNHANWNMPDVRIGPASSPNLNAGKIIGSTGGRVMQMGVRILF